MINTTSPVMSEWKCLKIRLKLTFELVTHFFDFSPQKKSTFCQNNTTLCFGVQRPKPKQFWPKSLAEN